MSPPHVWLLLVSGCGAYVPGRRSLAFTSSKVLSHRGNSARCSVLHACAPTEEPNSLPVQVFMDIDDTIKSSGGVRFLNVIPLGGIDTQYRRGFFYPGVFQFVLEMSRHQLPPDGQPLRPVVISARAREFGFTHLKEQDPLMRAFSIVGHASGFPEWHIGKVLYGSMKDWVSPQLKANRKFKNYEWFMQGMQNCSCIFVGDTGEGDVEAGRRMVAHSPKTMQALFFHVVDVNGDYSNSYSDKVLDGVPMFFFKTYVGAATKAMEAGLLSAEGLGRVVLAAQTAQQVQGNLFNRKSSKWRELRKDLAIAEELLAAHGHPEVDLPADLNCQNSIIHSKKKRPRKGGSKGSALSQSLVEAKKG